MCFSSKQNPVVQAIQAPAAPTPTAPPTPAPLPSPTPTKTESAVTDQQRRSRIASMRYGLLSTIKTGPQGVAGTGANLSVSGGKKKLGE